MRTVIERLGHSVDDDGLIHYDERPRTYEHAEQLAGRKLDRRVNYCIIDGDVCASVHFSGECSGCDGAGCHECGHHGTVRQWHWVPIKHIPDSANNGPASE